MGVPSAGGTSYAILSGDYANLSAKFGYHFATIDALCGQNSSQNYISLQFSGGAGSYYGRSLRIALLGSILKRLGFQVTLKGDLIEAFIAGYDKSSTEDKLDQMGRLLASSRLLDMALSDQREIDLYSDAFFREDYDFLSARKGDALKNFYTHGGWWERSVEDGRVFLLQDGARSGLRISSGVAGIMGKLAGKALQDFLDNIEAYYSFPLAIAKNSEMSDGIASVRVKPVGGHIDRAGGIAFGMKNVSNYFVLRINALEDNVILFEYVNSRRIERASAARKITAGAWHTLRTEISGSGIKGYFDEELVIEYSGDKPIIGFIGLWTKADSVTIFDELTMQANDRKRIIGF
jgi:pyruvate,water dikinase